MLVYRKRENHVYKKQKQYRSSWQIKAQFERRQKCKKKPPSIIILWYMKIYVNT